EGIDLSPVLTGRVSALDRTLFWEFHGSQRGGPPSGTLVVREGDWKLHVDLTKGRRELYNLRKDPGEKENVSEREETLAARLEKKARSWFDGLPLDKAPRQRRPVPETEAEANRLPPER